MKRLSCFVLAFCMLILNFASICAVESDDYEVTNVSELSDAELYAVLTENGFVFPEQVNEEKRCNLINGGLKKIVAEMENNPQYGVGASYTVLADLYESIRDSLAKIYGWDTSRMGVNAVNDGDSGSNSVWDHSEPFVDWDETMRDYNCYAYALGMTDDKYDPGNFAEEGFEVTDGASVLADVTKLDLGVLGYNCVKIQSYRPTAYGSWSNIIAVRRQVKDDMEDVVYLDYHYIKLSQSDLAWLHKPGSSTIMKLIRNPSNTEIWTNEGIRDGVYSAGTIKYGGSIYYILYKANHGGTTRVWTGEHYHSGTQHYYLYANVCSDCGDYKSTYWVSEDCSGPPCSVANRIVLPELDQ